MFWIFGSLSLTMLAEAILSLWKVLAFRKFFDRKLNEAGAAESPRVALVAPCKGVDFELRKNIQSWIKLDYPNYKIFFVVDSEEDSAVPVLRSFANAELLIAGRAVDSGQKVHNLRFATSQIPPGYEVFVIVDSDCRLSRDWLRNLVTQLLRDPENAATGYRWFRSGSNFGSNVRAAWNSSVLTLYQENGKDNFAWGGATGIFRNLFVASRVLEFWKGSISDDYSLTNALKCSNRRVNFVPGAMAFTDDRITFFEFINWAFRQLLITRIYHPKLWVAALLFHVAWFFWILSGLFYPLYFWPVFVVVQLIQSFKADLRWQCIREIGNLPIQQRIWLWVMGPVTGLCNLSLT
ncbi:MAG: glycosyltransferase family 2 protein, partial [Acidobacteriota bacterium]